MVENIKTDKYSAIKTAIVRSKQQTPDAGRIQGLKKGNLDNTVRLSKVKDMILSDEDLRAFFSILRDAILSAGYELTGDNQTRVKECYDFLEQVKFRKKLKIVLFSGLTLKHSFLELERSKNKKVFDIHTGDATYIYPTLKDNGKILRYNQDLIVTNNNNESTRKTITWELAEMAHFTFDDQYSGFYNKDILYTIESLYALKQRVIEHLQNMFKHNVFKLHYHGTNVSTKDIQGFTDMIWENYNNNSGISVTVGKEPMVAHKYVDETAILPLIELLNLIRNKFLTLLRVPPIIAGTVDNSNRSNSDTQADVAFQITLDGAREDLEDDINSDFLPKCGFDDVKFRFKKQDLRDIKKLSEILSTFLGAGADEKKINKWLKDLRYGLPVNLFKEKKEQPMVLQNALNGDNSEDTNNGVTKPQNSPLFESRQPQDNFGDKDYGNLEKNKE